MCIALLADNDLAAATTLLRRVINGPEGSSVVRQRLEQGNRHLAVINYRNPGHLPGRRAPAAEVGSVVEKHFHQAEDTCVLNLDAGYVGPAGCDRQSQPLEKWKVDMHVQSFCLEGGKSVGDRLQIVQRFPEAKVLQVIAQRFQAEKRRELLVHAQESIQAAGAENMTAMVEALQHTLESPRSLWPI
jgi:hypothetical protein